MYSCSAAEGRYEVTSFSVAICMKQTKILCGQLNCSLKLGFDGWVPNRPYKNIGRFNLGCLARDCRTHKKYSQTSIYKGTCAEFKFPTRPSSLLPRVYMYMYYWIVPTCSERWTPSNNRTKITNLALLQRSGIASCIIGKTQPQACTHVMYTCHAHMILYMQSHAHMALHYTGVVNEEFAPNHGHLNQEFWVNCKPQV